LGCPQLSNSLESLFDKEGLREFGARGLNRRTHDPDLMDFADAASVELSLK
jgi:hypothetical protein